MKLVTRGCILGSIFFILTPPLIQPAEAKSAPPKLVVVIVVDQMGAEVFERLAPQYAGGFKTFSKRGLRFLNAHHDHAMTQTAPGHLALLSGRHPGLAGIPANEFFDRTQNRIVYGVEDAQARPLGSEGKGVSYRAVFARSLGDWLKGTYPKSLVYSVAGKDRSAVLMGGREANGVFWFDAGGGGFSTSTFYAKSLPPLAADFNARKLPDQFFGQSWERVLNKEDLYLKYAGIDDAPGENVLSESERSPVFPHRIRISAEIESPDTDWYKAFSEFPWMDAVTLNFAQHIVESAQLGMDDAPDLLCVSLSAFDAIGHTFGPNSQEIMDAALRIDRTLGAFLKFLDNKVGKNNVLTVFTSDHGAQPLVEWSRAHGIEAYRINAEVRAFKDRVLEEFKKKYGDDAEKLFLFRGLENIHFNHDMLKERGIHRVHVYQLVRDLAASETWIAQVFDRDQLMGKGDLGRIGERVRHSFHPLKGADLYLIPKPNHLTYGGAKRGTSHGTPYDYDSHVPLIFLWSKLPAKSVDRAVRTVDLAPTLAEILGIRLTSELDGEALPELKTGR